MDERLDRYKFVWKKFGPPADGFVMGGFSASLAIEELRLCYVEGFYLACVVLAQIFVENSLGQIYILAGEEQVADRGFARLIDRALQDNLIDKPLAEKLHLLRKMRNPYVHLKAGAGGKTIIGRMIGKSKEGKRYESLHEFAEEDAIQAINITVDFLEK